MMSLDHPWKLTATQAARAVRGGSLSSVDLVASCLARVDEVGGEVNAVVDVLRDEALAAARTADAQLRAGEPVGILHGVPVTVKINVDVAGRPTTNGVVAFADDIAGADSEPVRNLRQAGAIILGRTNVPAFSTRYFSDNDLHGRTINPRDAQLTPGGSSGGAAAAVATGMGAIGHGNDRAGSIRYPAYACGIYGLRPTVGRVADYNPSAQQERGIVSQLCNVQGPLARTVDDLRLGLAALGRRSSRDPWWVPGHRAPARVDRPCKVAVMTGGFETDLAPAVMAALRKAAGWLSDAGYAVEEAQLPHFPEIASTFWPLLMAEERGATEQERAASSSAIERFADRATRRSRSGTEAFARDLSFTEYVRALADRTAMRREWLEFFDDYNLCVMPASTTRPFQVDADQGGDSAVAEVLRANLPLVGVSLMGTPSVAVPTTQFGDEPCGVQIVGAPFDEERCLAAADVCESRLGTIAAIDPVLASGVEGSDFVDTR